MTVKILEEFYRTALKNGSLPIILVYPDRSDLRGRVQHKVRKYEPVLEALKARERRYIDIIDAFVANDPDYKVEELTLGQWGHYSARGNRIIAEYLVDCFTRHELDERSKIRMQVEREVRTSAAAK